MKLRNASALFAVIAACLFVAGISSAALAQTAEKGFYLSNSKVGAKFNQKGLVSIKELASDKAVAFNSDNASLTVDDQTLDTAKLTPTIKKNGNAIGYTYTSNGWTLKVVYELKPTWGFVTKQLFLTGAKSAAYRVKTINMLSGEVDGKIVDDHKINGGSYGTCLRLGEDGKPSHGLLIVVQNPFNKWSYEGRAFGTSYVADMDWKTAWGAFESDRLILAPYTMSGTTFPAKVTPEYKYVQDPEAVFATDNKIDMAEIDAYQGAVAAFITYSIKKSVRIDVGWCVNDYQIDCGTPEGRTEYKRVIDATAALGGEYILYAPANSEVSSERESRDAWGWENCLFFGMGQKIRKDEWDPAKDAIPASVQEMLDYAKSKNIRLVAYAYPTMPWMQDLSWTAWCNNKPGGYSGADTGIRSFQDWFVKKLVAFQKKTGAGGFAFDHWWIAYDANKEAAVSATSRYSQWYGCRRIIVELRKACPDIVIDGRQQYHWFGPWTWIGGSYPHPFGGDEQPGSFRARADLHTDRLSANHIRAVNWRFRMENFCPPEMVPGYMTHQTQRSDAKGTMHRDPWRRADWDLLGWKYSVISSIATAPLNHVLNFLPARDTAEFAAFSKEDQLWWKNWMDWTDKNMEVLRNYRYIAPPMIGRTDGTAAFKDDHGFVFLFNANYRKMNAEFTLDSSIGLAKGKSFIIKQLYPIVGQLMGKPGEGVWKIGDKVSLPMDGASAIVLSVEPASEIKAPTLFNSTGKAALKNGNLDLTDVTGEVGTSSELVVAVPEGQTVKAVTVNGQKVQFTQSANVVSASVKFAGAPFSQCQQVGTYDPTFSETTFKGEFTIPARIFAQLAARKLAWPVPYTEDDLIAPWIGPDRLLLFVNIPEASPTKKEAVDREGRPVKRMEVTIKIDGQPIQVKEAFNGIYPNSGDQTFIGFYADVANLKPDTKYQVEVGLPKLEPGQFQGLYFDNVETEYTKTISK